MLQYKSVRAAILVLYAALLVTASYFVGQLQSSPNNRLFFDPAESKFEAFLEFEKRYGSNTEIIFFLRCADSCAEGAVADAVRWLDMELRAQDFVSKVNSLASFAVIYEKDDELISKDLLSVDCLVDANCVQASQSQMLPVVGRLVTPDRSGFVVSGSIEVQENASFVVQFMEKMGSLRDRFSEKHPDIYIAYTGGVPMMEAFLSASSADLAVLLPVAGVTFVILIFLVFGNMRVTGLLLAHSIATVLITLGLMGALGVVLNTATSTLPLVIMTLVIATSMHFYVDVANRVGAQDLGSRERSIAVAISAHKMPLTLTTLTSCVGLLSMLSVESPPLKEIGLWSAIGLIIGSITTLTVIPIVFRSISNISPSRGIAVTRQLLNNYARTLENKRASWVWVVLIAVVALVGIQSVVIDEDFVRYFPEDSEFRRGAADIQETLHSPYHIAVEVVTSGTSVLDPDVVGRVNELRNWLASHEEIRNIYSIYDPLEVVAKSLVDDPGPLEQSLQANEQFLLMFELGLRNDQQLSHFISVDRTRVYFSILLGEVTMKDIRELGKEIELYGSRITESTSGEVTLEVTGEGLMSAILSVDGIKQMGIGICVSLLFSSIIIGMYFGRISIGVLVFCIVLVPMVIGIGLWSLIVGSIGLSATLVVAVTIGVVVDDAIHLLYRYGYARDELSFEPSEAASYGVHRVGPAMIFTSVILGSGFLVLALSDFQMNRDYGLGASLVVLVALLFHLFITPKLLSLPSVFR